MFKNSYHYGKLYNRFFEILKSEEAVNFICQTVKERYKRVYKECLYDFLECQIKYYGFNYDIFDKWEFYRKNFPTNVTEARLVYKYGITEGTIRWNNYKEKQAFSNSLEYKKIKYGWTFEQFENYNKSRAVTLDNLIKKHGIEKGTITYNNYITKQKVNGCTIEYFRQKYGSEIGEEKYHDICSKKILNLENFIRKYGKIDGEILFLEFLERKSLSKLYSVSSVSQELFKFILNNINEQYHKNFYFEDKNKEYFFYNKNYFYMVDFYDISKNKVIEFYGDYYHANPKKYDKDFYIKSAFKNADKIWEYDKLRKERLIKDFGVDFLVIWEYDYRNNLKEVIDNCLKFLNYEN